MQIKDKTILITGAAGLVGLPTIKKCLDLGAKQVIAVDLRQPYELVRLKQEYTDRLTIQNKDLNYLHNCEELLAEYKPNIVLHLAGIKGSPTRAVKQPADYLFPMVMFNTNMIKASFDAKVDWFVYMSSVGVYQPSELMKEDDVWQTMPSKNDWYPGWSKRMGELALESLAIQYNWNNWTIIRPSNIYGIYDNFSPEATVIGSNIYKIFNVDGDMVCWGDGSAKRDFVFSEDVAQSAIDAVEKEVKDIINFGSANAVSIKETIEIIVDEYEKLTGNKKQVVWDTTKPNGDMIRRLDPTKQIKYDILPRTTLRDGIRKTINNYKDQLK
jgi:GDP-L-fucose synthase